MKRGWFTLFVLVLPFVNGRAAESNRLTLAQCLTEVVAQNRELAQFRVDVERATGTKLVIRSADVLQVALQTTAGWRAGPLYGHNGPYAIFTAQFSQPVLNGGIASTWRRGQCEVLAAQQRFNLAVSDSLTEARNEYLQLERQEQVIALYEEIEARLQTNVAGEERRRDIGLNGPRPALQAKLQLLGARGELSNFRRDEYETQTRLAQLMQWPVDRLPLPSETLTHERVNVEWGEQARLAAQRRPDLKFLRELARLTGEDRQTIAAGYFPYVSLIGSGLFIPGKNRVYQATQIVEGQTPLATEARFGGSLSWQIIDNGQVAGPERRAEAVRREYEISLQRIEENIPRELARIEHSLEDQEATLAALDKSADKADEDLRLIETRIGIGEATQLDFSNAQRSLLAVRHGIVDALFQYNWALAELDAVTGKYLEFAEPAAAR